MTLLWLNLLPIEKSYCEVKILVFAWKRIMQNGNGYGGRNWKSFPRILREKEGINFVNVDYGKFVRPCQGWTRFVEILQNCVARQVFGRIC